MKALIECTTAALLAFGFVMLMALIYGLTTSSVGLALFSLKCLIITIVAAFLAALINVYYEQQQLRTSMNVRFK